MSDTYLDKCIIDSSRRWWSTRNDRPTNRLSEREALMESKRERFYGKRWKLKKRNMRVSRHRWPYMYVHAHVFYNKVSVILLREIYDAGRTHFADDPWEWNETCHVVGRRFGRAHDLAKVPLNCMCTSRPRANLPAPLRCSGPPRRWRPVRSRAYFPRRGLSTGNIAENQNEWTRKSARPKVKKVSQTLGTRAVVRATRHPSPLSYPYEFNPIVTSLWS